MSRRRRQQERQKSNRLNRQTTTLHLRHVFLYISVPTLHNFDLKMPNFTFYGAGELTTTKISFSF